MHFCGDTLRNNNLYGYCAIVIVIMDENNQTSAPATESQQNQPNQPLSQDITPSAESTEQPPSVATASAIAANQVLPTAAPQASPTTTSEKQPSAGIFVLQWLTYALWGWTLLILIWVIFAIVLTITNQSDMGLTVLYPISAILILLPASVVVDSIYSKKEPLVKKGWAMAIMVIHAVIYVLFLVGFLIGAMASLVSILIDTGSKNDAVGYLISCLVVSACYVLLTIRTLRPQTFGAGQVV